MDSEAELDAGQATVPAAMNPDAPPPEGAGAEEAEAAVEDSGAAWVREWDKDGSSASGALPGRSPLLKKRI
jgi:hypothetical protein